MQLIMDTEPSTDIQEKMSAIEEPLDTILKNPIENLKNDIVNGNKENIVSPKNILDNKEEAINGEELKCIDVSSITPVHVESIDSVSKDEEVSGDVGNKTEDIVNNIIISEVSNGNSEHVDKETCDRPSEEEAMHDEISIDDSKVEELIQEEDSSLKEATIIPEQKIEEGSGEELDKNILEEKTEVKDVALSNEEDSDLGPECINPVKSINPENNDFDDNVVNDADINTAIDKMEASSSEKDDIIGNDSETEAAFTSNVTEAIKINDSEDKKTTSKAITNIIETSEIEEPLEDDIVTTSSEILHVKEDEKEKCDESTVNNMNSSEDENISETKKEEVNEEHSHETKKCNNDEVETTVPEEENISENSEIKSDDDVLNCVDITINKDDIVDVDEIVKESEDMETSEEKTVQEQNEPTTSQKAPICKLSNTLDILSDDEDQPLQIETPKIDMDTKNASAEKQCISIEDDDDIMLIDEDDTDGKDNKNTPDQAMETEAEKVDEQPVEECTIDLEKNSENVNDKKVEEAVPDVSKDSPVTENDTECKTPVDNEIKSEEPKAKIEEKPEKPLVAEDFLTGYKKNLADMTREELEEFCIVKIVESIVDRSNLSDIKSKLKTMAQNIEEYKKKAMMLNKQNRDLQLVLKSVQEEQKKRSTSLITPLKITRSVGMQVFMSEKPSMRKKTTMPGPATNVNNTVNNKTPNRTPSQSPRMQKPAVNNQQIPVPRLVPASQAPKPANPQATAANNSPKNTSGAALNGMKVNTPVQKTAEKRTHSRAQSVTVDLTDDEPPAKVNPRMSPAPPVRLVSPQNLLTPRPQFAQALNSPRKVYIPISGPQGQNIRPGQTIMLKSVPPPGQRLRGPAPHAARLPQNQVRLARVANSRHPAPLPECMKQYQPPNWKALPPAPDLKLSKVENGIVISWKIEGYEEDSYEEIASYQLYAYQETSSPPSTALWKKIGDVKALPLPMACTLTQFMAGFKYYFAVRAVDIRSRLGPFSLPGSILLLNKM